MIPTCSKSVTAEWTKTNAARTSASGLFLQPLIAGNDLTKMTPYTVAVLTTREVIAVDQDPLGRHGFRVMQEGPFEIWMKPMADGTKVIGLFNRQRSIEQIAVNFSQIGVNGTPSVRDL